MNTKVDEIKREEYEKQRASLRRQELVETKHEIANALYRYQGPTLVANGCVLLTGDYMLKSDAGLTSSRNVFINMSADELTDRINDGHIAKVFNPDDMNAPDINTRIDEVLADMNLQSKFEDADQYLYNDDQEKGLAIYVKDIADSAAEPTIDAIVECKKGVVVAKMASKDVVDDVKGAKECTYEEFNPGARDLSMQLDKLNPETQNSMNAYHKLREEYLANGENDVKEPSEILQDKTLSATEKLKAYTKAQNEKEQMNAEQQSVENNTEDMDYMPKSMRRLYS